MSNKNILCPDCELVYISSSAMKQSGKCKACYGRQYNAIRKNIPYVKVKDLSEEERIKIINKRHISVDNIKQNTEHKRKGKAPSDKRINVIKFCEKIKSENYTLAQILQLYNYKYKEDKLDAVALRNYATRIPLPHKPGKKGKQLEFSDSLIQQILDEAFGQNVQATNNVQVVENDISAPIVVENKISNNIYESKEEKCIDEEISNVLKDKCEELNCVYSEPYSLDYLTDLLRTISYLAKNYSQLRKGFTDQYDIMTAYQEDLLHEIEFNEDKEASSYLLDKLHTLRNKRREIQYSAENIATITKFLYTVNLTELGNTITALDNLNGKRLNIKYQPRVDKQLTKKYDWTSTTNVQEKQILYTNDKIQQRNNERYIQQRITPKQELKEFELYAVLHGGIYGEATDWVRKFRTNEGSTAVKWGIGQLQNILRAGNGKVHYTGFHCKEV